MAYVGTRITLLTNIPAPYRLAVWDHLDKLTRGRTKVLFIAPSESRRKWPVPIAHMAFDWRFLSHGPDPGRPLSQAASAVAMLVELFRDWPQTVICGGYDSVAAWICFCWCKLFQKRFVLWLESNARDSRESSRVKHMLKKWFVSRADAIAAAGKATVEYVTSLGAQQERIFLAPFGGDMKLFSRHSHMPDPLPAKHQLGLPPRLILYAGRLVRAKGIYVLFDAFQRISTELPGTGLLIVGHGPEERALRERARSLSLESVYFLGPQPYRRMPDYYVLADVLVLPSFSEPWGFVVNEAFACGVPAIVSRVAGACDDLIVDGETGFAIDPGNPCELADRVLCVLKDPSLRARMSENCRRRIQAFSAEACAEGLLAAVQGVRCEICR